MATIETLEIGTLATQDGDYARVAESNGTLFYASVDERELDADEIENAVAVADMDEDKFA